MVSGGFQQSLKISVNPKNQFTTHINSSIQKQFFFKFLLLVQLLHRNKPAAAEDQPEPLK